MIYLFEVPQEFFKSTVGEGPTFISPAAIQSIKPAAGNGCWIVLNQRVNIRLDVRSDVFLKALNDDMKKKLNSKILSI